MKQNEPSRAGLEPPAFWLTAKRANRLRPGDFQGETYNFRQILLCGLNFNSISSLLNESYIIEGATVIVAGLNKK